MHATASDQPALANKTCKAHKARRDGKTRRGRRTGNATGRKERQNPLAALAAPYAVLGSRV